MKKAKIIALSIGSDGQDAAPEELVSTVYELFEAIIHEDRTTQKFSKALRTVGGDDLRKKHVLIDRLIDQSAVKVLDLDGDGANEVIIFLNGMAATAGGKTVYILRREKNEWTCIGSFGARGIPQVSDSNTFTGAGYAPLESLTFSEQGGLVRSRFLFHEGRYIRVEGQTGCEADESHYFAMNTML